MDMENSKSAFSIRFFLGTHIFSIGFEPRELRPRKPPPSDGPCILEEILSAKSSLSSIATELSSGVIDLLSDNEDSGVIVISSGPESEQDESSTFFFPSAQEG